MQGERIVDRVDPEWIEHVAAIPDFFFYCYGDRRDLHSFPTRRSSDLVGNLRLVPIGFHRVPIGSHRFPLLPIVYSLVPIVYPPKCFEKCLSTDEVLLVKHSRLAWFIDRKSTRLNSSHVEISYAVFCLK